MIHDTTLSMLLLLMSSWQSCSRLSAHEQPAPLSSYKQHSRYECYTARLLAHHCRQFTNNFHQKHSSLNNWTDRLGSSIHHASHLLYVLYFTKRQTQQQLMAYIFGTLRIQFCTLYSDIFQCKNVLFCEDGELTAMASSTWQVSFSITSPYATTSDVSLGTFT